MVRDENSYYGSADDAPKLDSRYQLLFGTELTYQFLRLYHLLCLLLADIHEHITKHPPLDNPTDFYVSKSNTASLRKKKSPKLDYTSMQVALGKVIKGQMHGRDFESLARKIARRKVHQIAVLPVLIGRCVERLAKLADEDTLLHLYDYCRVKNVDPIAVQSQCLAVAPDAFYRIQMDASAGTVRFCCLENDSLLVYPEADNLADEIGGDVDMDDDDVQNDMDTGDDVGRYDDATEDDDDVVVPINDAKRARLI
jgi:hypothetical protein